MAFAAIAHAAWVAERRGLIEAATKNREAERLDYESLHTDYSESVLTLERAIAVLKELPDKEQAEPALMQVKEMKFIPQQLEAVLDDFFQRELGLVGRPSFWLQSSMQTWLEVGLEEIVAKRTALENHEVNRNHAYTAITTAWAAQVELAVEGQLRR
jgi:hypothetical protein